MEEVKPRSGDRWRAVARMISDRKDALNRSTDENFNVLNQKATYLAVCSNYKANVYRVFHIIINFIIIVSGVTIGTTFFASGSLQWINILGYVVSVLKILDELFNLGDAAIHFKTISTRCHKIARSIKPMKNSLDQIAAKEKIEELFDELDEIEMSLFQFGLNPAGN